MLIELRSSSSDPNNTPSNLMSRFKETMLIRPNTKVALVSALITTENQTGYTIGSTNDTFQMTIHGIHNANDALQTITLTHGIFTGAALATEIQTKIQAAILAIDASLPLTLYPNANVNVDFDDTTGFEITIHADPQDWSNTRATVADGNAKLNLTSIGGFQTPALYGGDTPTCYAVRTNQTSTDNRGITAEYPILLKNGNADGAEWATEDVGVNVNDIIWGLSINDNEGVSLTKKGHWYLDRFDILDTSLREPLWVDKFATSQATANSNTFFERYLGANEFDWILQQHTTSVGFLVNQTTYYCKWVYNAEGLIIKLGLHNTDIPSDPTTNPEVDAYFFEEDADGFCRVMNSDKGLAGSLRLFSAGMQRENLPETYARVSRTKKNITIVKGSRVIGTHVMGERDRLGLKWLLKGDINDADLASSILSFQYRIGAGAWTTLTLSGTNTHAHIKTTSYVYGIESIGGKLNCAIGDNSQKCLLTSTFYSPANLTVSNAVGATFAGEQWYDVSATPKGGWWIAVAGTATVGSQGNPQPTLSGVLPMGRGFNGNNNYTPAEVIQIKGMISGATADLTFGVKSVAFTLSQPSVASVYQTGYAYALNTISRVPFSPPYGTDIRTIAELGQIYLNITNIDLDPAVLLMEADIIGQTGNCMAGDVFEIQQPGLGVGAVVSLTVNQVSESTYQNRNLQLSSYKGLTYDPMDLQNQVLMDMTDSGSSSLANDLNLIPAIYNAEAIGTPIISSSSLPDLTNTSNETILVQADDFPIDSRNGVGDSDNHIATIPYQTNDTAGNTQRQFIQPYNLIYHKLKNTEEINLNHVNIRLTDFDGTERTDLKHPTELTVHLIEDYG